MAVIKDKTVAANIFLLKRLLELTATNAPIITSAIALKQYESNALASINTPQSSPATADTTGELKIENAVRIGKISNGVMPFMVSGKTPV